MSENDILGETTTNDYLKERNIFCKLDQKKMVVDNVIKVGVSMIYISILFFILVLYTKDDNPYSGYTNIINTYATNKTFEYEYERDLSIIRNLRLGTFVPTTEE
jgi:uncharacterized membrane protein